MADVKWTAKLPLLALGLVAAAGGIIALANHFRKTGIVLILLGLLFVGYSLTIKDWCAVKAHGWGDAGWSQTSFGACAKAKGWLSF